MGVLRLEPFYYLLWATPRGEDVPFEVSREVTQVLQPRCATSPYCPDEMIPRIRGERTGLDGEVQTVARYVHNPHFRGVTDCPYAFVSKEECRRDQERALTRFALFDKLHRERIANFLEALGYHVDAERIGESDIECGRVLQAHGATYNFHEIRFEHGPGNLPLVMIRNPYDPDPRGSRQRQEQRELGRHQLGSRR